MEKVLEEPEVWGVESLSKEGVVLRLVQKTAPLEQGAVERELRERVLLALLRKGHLKEETKPRKAPAKRN